MKKSTRHSKITGDFAEALVLYWLSKYGYECARVDHTGIDLIARNPDSPEVMGISVKSRSRYAGTESGDVDLPAEGFAAARQACEAFRCTPYYAIVVDAADAIRCFLLSLPHLELVAGVGAKNKERRFWRMRSRDLTEYRRDPHIMRFELGTQACSWRDKHSGSLSQQVIG